MTSPQPLYGASALGRTIDFQHPSNVVAILGSLAVAALFATYNLFASAPLHTSWGAAGTGAFLAWAIAREMDPDNPNSAAAAIAVSTIVSLVASPSLITALGFLLGARLLTGSANDVIGRFDPIAIVGLGALLGMGRSTLVALPVLVAGVVVMGDRSTRSILTAVLTAGACGAAMVATEPLVLWQSPDAWTVGFLLATLLALVIVIPAAQPVSQSDCGESTLIGWRVSATRVAGAATIGIAFAVSGEVGTKDVLPTIGAALLAVAITHLAKRVDSSAKRPENETSA